MNENCGAATVGACNKVIQFYQNSLCRIKNWQVSRLHNQEDNERNLQDIRTNYSQMSRRIFQTVLK